MSQITIKEFCALLGIEKVTVMTLTNVIFNDLLSLGPIRSFSSMDELRPLVVAFLDAGIPVDTYWKDIDYTQIDMRLPKGHRV